MNTLPQDIAKEKVLAFGEQTKTQYFTIFRGALAEVPGAGGASMFLGMNKLAKDMVSLLHTFIIGKCLPSVNRLNTGHKNDDI